MFFYEDFINYKILKFNSNYLNFNYNNYHKLMNLLPLEIIQLIFDFLNFEHKIKLKYQICKKFYKELRINEKDLKCHILYKLGELRNLGYEYYKYFDINSNYNAMLFEYEYLKYKIKCENINKKKVLSIRKIGQHLNELFIVRNCSINI